MGSLKLTRRVEAFTLIELIVVMALFAILASLFYYGLSIINRSSALISKNFNTEIELNNFMQHVNFIVSDADSVIQQNDSIKIYKDHQWKTLLFKDNAIYFGKDNMEEVLHADSIGLSVNYAHAFNVDKIELSVLLQPREYHYLLRNRKQIKR